MYFCVEIQTYQGGTGATIVTEHSAKNEALSKYHTVLSYAAVSDLPAHSCVVLDEEGRTIAREAFVHNVPETSPEE